jgi:hypothetical protein
VIKSRVKNTILALDTAIKSAIISYYKLQSGKKQETNGKRFEAGKTRQEQVIRRR